MIATAALIGAITFAVAPGRGQIVGVVMVPLWAIASWRAWTTGVHVEDDGVTVVSLVRSKHVPWEKIDHFAVLPWANYP